MFLVHNNITLSIYFMLYAALFSRRMGYYYLMTTSSSTKISIAHQRSTSQQRQNVESMLV